MDTQQQAIIAQMNTVVIAKALTDAAYRAALLEDPRAVVEREFGVALPAGFTLEVVEAKADSHVIVLPYAPAVGADGELSDADLEAVAGGSKAGAREFFVGRGGDVISAVAAVATFTVGGVACDAIQRRVESRM